MNYIQLILFILYVLSVYSSGVGIHYFLFKRTKIQSRALFIGEALLLGSIWVIGLMVVVSLIHCYQAAVLWTVVLGQCIFFKSKSVREQWLMPWKGLKWDPWLLVYGLLIGFFFFRNSYFLMDPDSHSSYLFAQKLWLEHKTSVFASTSLDVKVLVPHFNAVPYALGLSVFPKETFFPQLIVAFWTIITTLLVFGYLSYRFNRAYALSGVFLVLFNDHMFYSGANNCVIINSALVALMVAVAYNFYEASRSSQSGRFILALIFASQLPANKYQALYTMCFFMVTGFLVQKDLKQHWKEIKTNHHWIIGLAVACGLTSTWFLKNLLATGCPTFPIFAGEMGVLNWTKDMAHMFNHVMTGPLSFSTTIKYLSYMFIWPGVNAAKIVLLLLTFLPLWMMCSLKEVKIDKEKAIEVLYWLALCVLSVIGVCLVSFVDPRHYRYAIGIMAITAVILTDFILRHLFKCPVWLITVLILLIAIPGWRIMISQASSFLRPTFKDNINVLTNHLHTQDRIYTYYPANAIVDSQLSSHSSQLAEAAWDTGTGGGNGLSAFWLPTFPQIGLWFTSTVRWDSYSDPHLIEQDLQNANISWVMSVQKDRLVFEPVADYALRAARFERHSKTIFYNYGFPEELSRVN